MIELKELHHHHISILGFNHLSEWALQQLLLYYAKMYLPTYDANDPEVKVVSKIFNYLKDNNIKLLKSMKIFNFDGFVRTVYTDDSKEFVKEEISITCLDIDVVVNVLKQIKCFPVKDVNKFDCSNSRLCSNCSDKSNCRVFGSIKRAIDALLRVRHLAAHQAKDLWIQLENGSYRSPDFQNGANFHQLWDVYTDHLKTVIKFLKDNEEITETQFNDRIYELVKYGNVKDSGESDNNILQQYANYVMVHEGKRLIEKSIDITFDIAIEGDPLPRRIFAMDGELMDHVKVYAENSIAQLVGVNAVKIIKRGCYEKQQHADSVRVEITISHQSPQRLQGYNDMENEQSEKFWKDLFVKIKHHFSKKYEKAVEIVLKQWKPGSIKLVFNIENLDPKDVQFEQLKEFMKKLLASLMPDCRVDLFIHHEGSNCLLYTSPSPRDS